MATELSDVRNLADDMGDEPGPSPFYKTRVRRALELLLEAEEDDVEYQGDMMMEGIREGLMGAAVLVVRRLLLMAELGELARNPVTWED